MKFRICSSLLLLALTSPTFAVPAPVETVTTIPQGLFYMGIFAGGGSFSAFSASQYGAVFAIEAEGGPLAVNALGQINGQSTSFLGGQVGYQAPDIFLNFAQPWALEPAAELEGYALRDTTLEGAFFNNTVRLPGHSFLNTYPVNQNVFLINAVLGFFNPAFIVHPYIGFGIGGATINISEANSTQTVPFEAGINHYNINPNDASATFARQIKVGLSVNINRNISLFADYRSLYLASSQFVFGSTVYPATHAETSSWRVAFASQRYNLGDIGIRLNF